MNHSIAQRGRSRIIAYLVIHFVLRNKFTSEPAAPMFNSLAIQFRVIVVFARSRSKGSYKIELACP
jgi:hypothetical protein